ncbi:TQXA domain-containing protein [Clostridium cavendishii DSM 21758]|uniref:TQXA domain-containing protein n=1 Tax=Clostridium cavendishii DSM 21758 TaxID=1121302 RepID=A0A1M6I7H2_9CLOT|nr:thioester domain-containing protein [Clostridium cavendishii]SHJ30389.1 TQXA domain-containing protein [Clostridium cavendishii DSM 21758]
MKKRRLLTFIIIFLIVNVWGTSVKTFSLTPEPIKINTFGNDIAKVKYGDYSITSKLILAEGKIAYCLDINKNYPSGQDFYLTNDVDNTIKSIIIQGYPIKGPTELGTSSEEEAYFSTQVAIWVYIEKFDINKITCDNKNIENAIKSIYTNGIANKNNPINSEFIFNVYSADVDTQRIITVSQNFQVENVTGGNFLYGEGIGEGGNTLAKNADPTANKITALLPQTGMECINIVIPISMSILGVVILLRKQFFK